MHRRTLLTCCAPQLLVAVDFALLAVAAPGARDELGLGDADVRWLFSAYSLTFGCLLLPAGRLADRAGRLRVLRSGMALFALGAAAAAAAPGPTVLIAARVLAGAGAALMTPAALALLAASTREGVERRGAMSTYGAAVAIGFVLGALTGGALASAASWRPLFLAIAATGGAALLLSRRLPVPALPPPPAPEPGARHAAREILRPRVLVACAAGMCVTATGVAATVLLTQYLQEGLHLSPFEAGLALASFGAAFIPAAHAVRRLEESWAASAGLAVQAAAVLALAWCVSAGSIPALVPALAAFGFGNVVANAGVALIALGSMPARLHGAIGGVLSTAQYLGAALGPLTFGALAGPAGAAQGVRNGLVVAGATGAACAVLLLRGGRSLAAS